MKIHYFLKLHPEQSTKKKFQRAGILATAPEPLRGPDLIYLILIFQILVDFEKNQ
jgi:hypothetical protein